MTHEHQTPITELKGSLTFYLILTLAIFSIIGIAIYMSSCTAIYDSDYDNKIQVEKDGHLYSVSPK
jgi:hypothetical protein